MARTRDNYRVSGNTPQEIIQSLNFLLQRLADRIDKLEGIRGTASIESDLEMNSNRIREVGEGDADDDGARLDDLLTEPLFLSRLTVSDDTTLNDVAVGGNIEVFDDSDQLIHSME